MTTPFDPYSLATGNGPSVPQSQIPGSAVASSSMTIQTSQLNFASYAPQGGMFGYTGTPGAQALFFSVSPLGGTDPYGNTFPTGLAVQQGNLSGMAIVGSAMDSTSILTGTTLNQGAVVQPSITGGTAVSTLHVVNNAGGGVYSYSQNSTTVTFTVSTAAGWTCPTGVTHAQVQCWAAGAGGDGGSTTAGGVAGGAGEYAAEPSLAVIPGQVYGIQVGVGGTGGATGNPGNPGSNTIFGANLVFANGGLAGSGTTGGIGGSGSANSIEEAGGNGGNNPPQTSGGAGGGGSGGTAAPGNNGTDSSSSSGAAGGAAVAGGAAGGAGGAAGANASSGANPGGGGGGAGQGTNTTTTTNTYYTDRTISYYGTQVGSGLRTDSTNGSGTMFQGCSSGALGQTGDQYSFAIFDSTQIVLDLTGATINWMNLQLTNLHSWYNTGCYVVLGWTSAGAFGSVFVPGGGTHENQQAFWINENTTISEALNVSIFGAAFQTGGATGLVLGPSGSTTGGPTDLYNYGYFYGGGGSASPSLMPALTINFTTGGAGSFTGGTGGNGQIVITYTTNANTTLNASVSPIATTDAGGNTIPIGVMTSNMVAIQPSSSPVIPEVWHDLTLTASYVQFTGRPLAVKLLPFNMVAISGQFANTGTGSLANTTVATVTTPYRPARAEGIPIGFTATGDTFIGSYIEIETNGNILMESFNPSGTTGHIVVNGIYPLDGPTS